MGVVASMRFRFTSHQRLLEKMAAYGTLFDVSPVVYLDGTWTDDRGELVFLNGRQAEEVGKRGVIRAKVDGIEQRLRPTKDSWYTLAQEM